jgi:hypothetical protein
VIRCQVRVTPHHRRSLPASQFLQDMERRPVLHVPRGPGVAQMPDPAFPAEYRARKNAESYSGGVADPLQREAPRNGLNVCDSALFSALGTFLYRPFRNSRSLSLGRKRACLPVGGLVLASAASFSAR